jgi:hypothetical protein
VVGEAHRTISTDQLRKLDGGSCRPTRTALAARVTRKAAGTLGTSAAQDRAAILDPGQRGPGSAGEAGTAQL